MQGLEKSQLSPLVDLNALALLFKRYDREVSLRASMSVRRLTPAQICCVYMLNRDYAETGLFQHSCVPPRFGNHDNSARSAAGGLCCLFLLASYRVIAYLRDCVLQECVWHAHA
jgi:hypothetical protein